MISRREGKGPPSRDLLVCFPTRSHLTLMPKAVSSPRRHHNHHQKQLNHLRKSMRGGASPYLKQMSAENLSEPTSPKVTCAGQIKVRSRTGGCKNWQTVMEEIERLHINRKTKKKANWVEALGFKKEVMQFLACLRRIKFDFRCMGSFPHVDVTSDDDEDNDELGGNNDKEIHQNQDIIQDDDDDEVSSRTVFSKWFMVLQENNIQGVFSEDEKSLKTTDETEDPRPCLPPANALLLMRCRSAPAKSWMEEKQEEEERHEKDDDDDGHDEKVEEEEHADDNGYDDDKKKKVEKKEKKRKSLMELMKNDESEFYKLSCDIVKETWVIGGIHKDPFSRSRSWKR